MDWSPPNIAAKEILVIRSALGESLKRGETAAQGRNTVKQILTVLHGMRPKASIISTVSNPTKSSV
jgi:hypothetical protein